MLLRNGAHGMHVVVWLCPRIWVDCVQVVAGLGVYVGAESQHGVGNFCVTCSLASGVTLQRDNLIVSTGLRKL